MRPNNIAKIVESIKRIPNTIFVRAKVKIWNTKEQEFEILWEKGYLAPMDITEQGLVFNLMSPIGDYNKCCYIAGDEFCYLTKSYVEQSILFETIGRYTGLKDKNGTDIFEGDIVKTKYGRLCIIVWFQSPVHCGWDFDPILTAENCRLKPPTPHDLFSSINLEVVGNIHDNPIRVKKKEEPYET